MESIIDDYLRYGVSELHLYHLGLLSRAGLDDLRRVVTVARERTAESKAEGL